MSQTEVKWTFHGITIEEEVGCINKASTKHSSCWIVRDKDYPRKTDSLNKELKLKYGFGYSIFPVTVVAGKERYIALVERDVQCRSYGGDKKDIISYRFYSGDTDSSISRQIESDMKLYPGILRSRIIERIDCREKTGELEKARQQALIAGSANGAPLKRSAEEEAYCQKLVKYRDEKLLKEFNSAFDKYLIRQEGVADLQKQKASLASDNWWATSDGPILAATIKLYCDIMTDVLVIPKGTDINLTQKKDEPLVKVFDALKKKGETPTKAVNQEVAEAINAIALIPHPAARSIVALRNFANNIVQVEQTATSTRELRSEVQRQISAIDAQVKKYNEDLPKHAASIKALNDLKTSLDAYLAQNCY